MFVVWITPGGAYVIVCHPFGAVVGCGWLCMLQRLMGCVSSGGAR